MIAAKKSATCRPRGFFWRFLTTSSARTWWGQTLATPSQSSSSSSSSSPTPEKKKKTEPGIEAEHEQLKLQQLTQFSTFMAAKIFSAPHSTKNDEKFRNRGFWRNLGVSKRHRHKMTGSRCHRALQGTGSSKDELTSNKLNTIAISFIFNYISDWVFDDL